MRMRRLVIFRFVIFVYLLAGASPVYAQVDQFEPPEPVTIRGYDGHAMEPFISRDGQWLFFNNRNQPQDQTDLHAAKRVDDLTFDYAGPLSGANSTALEGVPSMDQTGRFYFVSPRDYDATRNTLWQAQFHQGRMAAVTPLLGNAPTGRPLWLNIDAEISADGATLYFTENRWRLVGGGVASSNLLVAYRDATGAFMRAENSVSMFAQINTDKLEFAPALTTDELTLYFTRVDRDALSAGVAAGFGIYVATRAAKGQPFGRPSRIAAISGYVEAPTVAPGACAIYLHKRVEQVFQIQRARKSNCP